MKGIYLNIASTVYAHAIHFDHFSLLSLEEKLNINEIEEAVLSIWHVYEQIWEMYMNGNHPKFVIEEYKYKSEITESVKRQIQLPMANKS